MQVRYFMTPDPVTIESQELIDDARRLMDELNIRHLPVTQDGVLVGVLSNRDVNNASIRVLGLEVEHVMSTPPLTIGPTEDIVKAARTMLAHRISGLPVVDEDGAIIGMITTTNCLIAMIQMHHELAAATAGAAAR